jgi:hypothetical protein
MAEEKEVATVETPINGPEKVEGPCDWRHRKAKHNGLGGIDCELLHPKWGWMPYTASPEDDLSREAYDRLINGSAGEVAPADPPTQEQTTEEWKEERARLVADITVVVDGKAFDGDEKSQDRMARAVTVLQTMPKGATADWTLADNTVAPVTLPVLTAALASSMQRMSELWKRPS